MPSICTPIANQHNLTVSRFYPHLRHLNLADPFDEKHMSIGMLVGIDYYHSFFLDEIIRGKENEPVAINSYLGWIVSGSFKHATFPSVDETNAFFIKNEPFSEVSNDNDLNDYFSQVFPNDSSEPESNESNVYSNFLKELKFVDSRYSVKLPFNIDTGVLPDNYSLAKSRLRNLKSRLDKNPALLKNYNNIINDYLNEGIIEPVSDNDTSNATHYLPHRPVVRRKGTLRKLELCVMPQPKHQDNIL